MKGKVERSIEIKAPRAAVWRWLASQDALRQWISPNIQIDLRLGGAYRFLGPDNATWIRGVVLELEPEQSLILSWFEEGGDWIHPGRLVFALASTTAGTRVSLIHDGFAGIGKADWPESVKDYERGASEHRILERLAELVTGGVHA